MQAYAWLEILRGYYVARKNDDRAGGGQTNISAVNHAQLCAMAGYAARGLATTCARI